MSHSKLNGPTAIGQVQPNRQYKSTTTSTTTSHRQSTADSASSSAGSLADDFHQFQCQTAELAEWLVQLRQLVEASSEFNAVKFSNYLEAETQLRTRASQLRAVCLAARQLCRRSPRLSPQVADRIHGMQTTWLAVEHRLGEFKSHRGLLIALSGDLKLLENGYDMASGEKPADEGHCCCLRKMELLDSTVRQKDSQLRQVLSVTSAISGLLDLICASDLLCLRRSDQQQIQLQQQQAGQAGQVRDSAAPQLRSDSRRSVDGNIEAQSVHPPSQPLSAPQPSPQLPPPPPPPAGTATRQDTQRHANTPGGTTNSTTYLRTPTNNTDGDQETTSDSSSEIITQTGHNSAQLEVNVLNSLEQSTTPPEIQQQQQQQQYEGMSGVLLSLPSESRTPSSDDHDYADDEGSANSERSADGQVVVGSGSNAPSVLDLSNNNSTAIGRVTTQSLSASPSPVSRTSYSPGLAVTSTPVQIFSQQQLSSEVQAIDSQLKLLSITNAALSNWQTELAYIREGIQTSDSTDTRNEALLRGACLDKVALLDSWITSLQDRSGYRQLELRLSKARLCCLHSS